MGIVQRQTIQSTLFSYLGTVFGFINVNFFYVKYLDDTEKVGLLTFINSSTNLLAMIFTLGIPLVTQNLFVRYKNKNTHHSGFLSIIMMISLIGITLGLLAFYIFNDFIIKGNNNAKAYSYFTAGWVILFVFRLIFKNLDIYLRMNMQTVIGVFLESFLSKILVTFGMLAFVFGLIEFRGVFWLNVISVSVPGLILILFLISQKERFFNFKYFSRFKARSKQIMSLAVFGLIGSIGTTFVVDIDKVMLSNGPGLNASGAYAVMVLFGMFITIPAINLRRATTPVLADAWKENDHEKIHDVYKRSASNQFIVGTFIFLGIWFCIDYAMEIFNFPYPYRVCKDVILFIGIAQLIDMATGVNSEIIATSKKYQYNTYFLGILAITVFVSNYFLIPVLGIEGAAVATMLSYIVVNIFRYAFLKSSYGFSPFSGKLFLAIGLGLTVFAILHFTPELDNPFIGIVLNAGMITTIYWLAVYFTKMSPEINKMIDKRLAKFK